MPDEKPPQATAPAAADATKPAAKPKTTPPPPAPPAATASDDPPDSSPDSALELEVELEQPSRGAQRAPGPVTEAEKAAAREPGAPHNPGMQSARQQRAALDLQAKQAAAAAQAAKP